MHRYSKRLVGKLLATGILTLLIAGTGAGVGRAADDTALRLTNVSAANTGYVRVANSAAFSLQEFTLEAWVQRVGAGYGNTTDAFGAGIIDKPVEGLTGSNLGSWHLNWTNAGQALFNVAHTVGTSGEFVLTPAVATPLARHHLAATFDGDTLRVFVDGALAGQTGWALGTVYYGNNDVLLGAENFGAGYLRRFDGFIDDARIWDHARTEVEIAAQMNCRLTGGEAGLVAYWTFDGSDLTDETGHGHGGVIGGLAGSVSYASLASLSDCTVGVEEELGAAATALSMSVFPQPTRDRVTVRFDLPRHGHVTLDLYDVAGRKLAALVSQPYAAGPHEFTTSLAGVPTVGRSAGLVFVCLRSAGQTLTRRVVLLN